MLHSAKIKEGDGRKPKVLASNGKPGRKQNRRWRIQFFDTFKLQFRKAVA